MGLLELEIKELRDLHKLVSEGKITPEEAKLRLAIFSESDKRVKNMINFLTLAVKSGEKVGQKQIAATNLTGDGSYIDLGMDSEIDKIKCPANEKVITRAECLDLSGSEKCPEECDGCKHFKTTRQYLLPKGA